MTAARIAVVGPVASGKSTLARAIAAHTGVKHVDLDDLFWEPGWTPAPPGRFLTRLEEALQGDEWIADGNYGGQAAEILLSRAELVLWLDLPLWTCLPRLISRSIRRAATGTELFAGNRETFSHLIARDSILWWGPAHHRRHRVRWAASLTARGASQSRVIRLTNPRTVAPALTTLGLIDAQEALCAT